MQCSKLVKFKVRIEIFHAYRTVLHGASIVLSQHVLQQFIIFTI